MDYPKLSILLPAFNEVEKISCCIREVIGFFERIAFSFEIVVMDDGSFDGTYQAALSVSHPAVRVYQSHGNGGKGKALQQAFQKARGEWILFLDADLDIHPSQFVPLWEQMNTGADVTIGCKQGRVSETGYPLSRRVLSVGYAYMVKTLFRLPLCDTQTGIKLFRREVLTAVFGDVQVKGYAFDLELLSRIHRQGYKISEVPVQVTYTGNATHITPQVVSRMMWDTMSIYWRTRFL